MLQHGVLGVLLSPKHPRFNSGRMSVVAVIRDPVSIREIIACLETMDRGPP
jgi:hypothetical protein